MQQICRSREILRVDEDTRVLVCIESCIAFSILFMRRPLNCGNLWRGHLWDRRLPEHVPQPELRKELDAALKGPDGRRSLEVAAFLKIYFCSFSRRVFASKR